MSRTSSDEVISGAVWNGYDYNLQIWVIEGTVQPCSHPASMGSNCCNQRKYAGQSIVDIPGREHRTED